MKINPIKSIIAICISGLISFGFFSFQDTENKNLICIGSFLFLSLTLLFSFSISFSLPRTTTIIRTVSVLFFALALISNLIFSFFNFSTPIYLIVNGIAILIYALIAYSICSAKQ
jgi:hypothetical protein